MRVVAIALSLVLAILGMSAAPRTAQASELPLPGGTLDARGPDGEVLGGCPLERTEVSSQISGFVARVIVKQTFRNPFPDPIEAVYTFPLSERGAVDGMWIRTEGREIRELTVILARGYWRLTEKAQDSAVSGRGESQKELDVSATESAHVGDPRRAGWTPA